MKILLFGMSNIGKTTLGLELSKRLNYFFEDLDDTIKEMYGTIDKFKAKYPRDLERVKQRGELLQITLDMLSDFDAVIVVSTMQYRIGFEDELKRDDVIAVYIKDNVESILKRLVYADENDKVFPIEIQNDAQRRYYEYEVSEDLKYFNELYSIIENQFDINGLDIENASQKLYEYVVKLIKNKCKNDSKILN